MKLGHVVQIRVYRLVQARTKSPLIYSRKGIRKRQFQARKSAWEGGRKGDAPRILPINHSAYREATGYQFALSRGAHGPERFQESDRSKGVIFKGTLSQP